MGEITKEEIKKLMEVKGETRGVTFLIDHGYILKNKGEEGLKKVEEEIEKLGHPIKYKEIETFGYYPVGLRILSLLAIKKVFDFDDKKIEEIGFFGSKSSLITKFFIKYVFSPKKVFLQEVEKFGENTGLWGNWFRLSWMRGKNTPLYS